MDPLVCVDRHSRTQDDRLGAEVIGHLDVAVHDSQGDVIRTLQPFPAPEDEALRGFRFDAQFKMVGLQGLLAVSTWKETVSVRRKWSPPQQVRNITKDRNTLWDKRPSSLFASLLDSVRDEQQNQTTLVGSRCGSNCHSGLFF